MGKRPVSEPWPYNLPIFRRSHKAIAPDQSDFAEIDKAYEFSMSSPTFGTLRTGSGLEVKNCSPSFIWSDDSRFLAAPVFFRRFGLFRMQKMLIIDMASHRGYLSAEIGFYLQPETFEGGSLKAIREPFKRKEEIRWRIPECLAQFSGIKLYWKKHAQEH